MDLHETDCTSLTSLTCRCEDSWTLDLVNPITGQTIYECAVTDNSDWLRIRCAAYRRAPKEQSCNIKYVVGQKVVPTGKTIKNVGLHGVKTVHVVYEHSRVEPCPMCRMHKCPEQPDEFERLVINREKEGYGEDDEESQWEFDSGQVTAAAGKKRNRQRWFDWYPVSQIYPLTLADWIRSASAFINASIFKHENSNDWQRFNALIISHLRDERLKVCSWILSSNRSSNRKSIFVLSCNECEYSIGCTWTKGSDPSHLAKVLWPFVHPQPQEYIASCKKYREAILSHTPTAIPVHRILQKYKETMALITRKEDDTKVKKITEGEGKSSKVQRRSDSVHEGKG